MKHVRRKNVNIGDVINSKKYGVQEVKTIKHLTNGTIIETKQNYIVTYKRNELIEIIPTFKEFKIITVENAVLTLWNTSKEMIHKELKANRTEYKYIFTLSEYDLYKANDIKFMKWLHTRFNLGNILKTIFS